MKDIFKRKRFQTLGWMASLKCKCCNWTLTGRNTQKKKRLVNKSTKAKMKQELRKDKDLL